MIFSAANRINDGPLFSWPAKSKSHCYWYYYYWIWIRSDHLFRTTALFHYYLSPILGVQSNLDWCGALCGQRAVIIVASIQLSMHPCCASSYRSWHHIGRSVITKCVATVPQAIQTVESVTISQSFRLSISILPSTVLLLLLLYASMPCNICTHKYDSTFASV